MRIFKLEVSEDDGTTWKNLKATGYPVGEIEPFFTADSKTDPYGYVIMVDSSSVIRDLVIPRRTLKLMMRDVDRLEREQANHG